MFDLSVTKAAEGPGVSRQALNNVVNQKAAISPDMAVRLEKGFGAQDGQVSFFEETLTATRR